MFNKKKVIPGKWTVPAGYMDKINMADAKFLYEHAEKQLKDVLDTSIIIANRTTTLVTITVGITVAVVGFSLNRWDSIHKLDLFLITALFGIAYLMILIIFLTWNVQPKTYATLGGEPKVFFSESLFGEKTTVEERQVFFYINEFEAYQHRIELNKATNNDRWKIYNISLWMVSLIPLTLVIVFIITYFISCSFLVGCQH